MVHVRTLGLQNTLRGTEFGVGEVESLLSYVVETDSDETPGILWYEHATDTFAAIPLHQVVRESGKAYLTQVWQKHPQRWGCMHSPGRPLTIEKTGVKRDTS